MQTKVTVKAFNEEVVRRAGFGMLYDVDPQRTSYLWNTQQETKRLARTLRQAYQQFGFRHFKSRAKNKSNNNSTSARFKRQSNIRHMDCSSIWQGVSAEHGS